MFQRLITVAAVGVLAATVTLGAQARITRHGRAIVEHRSQDVVAVASYEYAQRHHDGAWLLIEIAIQATHRIAVDRDQITIRTPDERIIPLATQPQFLEDSEVLTPLFQNAQIWRRSFSSYFPSRPVRTIRFVSPPGGVVSNSAVTNLDEVATGDLLFKAPDGKWTEGTYHLVLNHPEARADLPILLE